MRFPDRALVNLRAGVVRLSFAAAVFLGTGCVNLDKPKVVEDCVAAGGCKNGPPAPTSDAREANDDAERADLRDADDPVGSKEDLGPDLRVDPDAGLGDADSSDNRDAAGTEPRASSDLAPDVGLDTKVPSEGGADRGRDLGAEPGPDQADETDDVAKDDVAKDDVAKDDLTKDDVTKDDVTKDDIVKVDVEGPETPREAGASNCTIYFGSNPSTGSQGHPPLPGTKAVCIATCDDIAGWDCSNKDGRAVKVNGTDVSCGAAITKKNGYYVFELAAGTNRDFAIYWWVGSGSWATTCVEPAGGF
jgi:hypothetical protein